MLSAASLPKISSWIFAQSPLRANYWQPHSLLPGRSHFLHDFSTTIDKTMRTPAHTGQKHLILDNQLLCEAHAAVKSSSCRSALHKSCQIRHSLTMNADQLKLYSCVHTTSFCWYCQHIFFCALQSMGSSLKTEGTCCFETHPSLWRGCIDRPWRGSSWKQIRQFRATIPIWNKIEEIVVEVYELYVSTICWVRWFKHRSFFIISSKCSWGSAFATIKAEWCDFVLLDISHLVYLISLPFLLMSMQSSLMVPFAYVAQSVLYMYICAFFD